MKNAIQLKVTLTDTDPQIWRRVLIPSSITFFDLHHILQISMGWKNSHLFEFRVGDYAIGFIDDSAPENLADASEVTLDTLLTKVGMKFLYTYDYGDNWQHTIEVEKMLNSEDGHEYPVCIEGELNCPPEDCGGMHGYRNMLETLKDKNHPEYLEMREWAGRYNPKKFNTGKINKELPKFKEYMKMWRK